MAFRGEKGWSQQGGGRKGQGGQGAGYGGAGYGGGGYGGGGYGGGGYGGGGHGGGGRGQGGGPSVTEIYVPRTGSVDDPDSSVTKVENDIVNKSDSSRGVANLNLKQGMLPLRPGYGNLGKELVLFTNYFAMTISESAIFYRYDLTVTPEAQPKRKVERAIKLFLQAPIMAEFRGKVVTDFRKVLISNTQLDKEEFSYDIQHRDEGQDQADANATMFTIKVTYTSSLSMAMLLNYISTTSSTRSDVGKEEYIQAFNIFTNHYARTSANLAAVGGKKVFPIGDESKEMHQLQKGLLLAFRGYFTSARIATSRLLMNVNVSNAAFYPSKGERLDNIFEKWLDANYREWNFEALQKFLKGLMIYAIHDIKRNKAGNEVAKPRVIVGLANVDEAKEMSNKIKVEENYAAPQNVKFYEENKKRWRTVSEFFETEHIKKMKKKKKGFNITLSEYYPVIRCGSKERPIFYPAEFCHVLPHQPYNSQLTSAQTAEMMKFAVRGPAANATSIVESGFNALGLGGTNPLLEQTFRVSFSENLITVKGRRLDPPTIHYQNSSANINNASWNMLKHCVSESKKQDTWKSWKIVMIREYTCIRPRKTDKPRKTGKPQEEDKLEKPAKSPRTSVAAFPTLNDASKFENSFKNGASLAGIRLPPTLLGTKEINVYTDDFEELEELLEDVVEEKTFLLIFLPKAGHALYSRIKHLADVVYGVPTICMGNKLATDKSPGTYIPNVLLKFNLKLGGTNHRVVSDSLGLVEGGKTMIVGIDVTHAVPGSDEDSVAGMVASRAGGLGQWPAELRIQETKRQEKVDLLSEMLTEHLKRWKGGKELPENIIVYRDGVSEGQYAMVLEDELPRLREACKKCYSRTQTNDGVPRMTVAIVGKRHHTRFYPTTLKDAVSGGNGNCQPGTVVDRGITEAQNWDFFIQPHHALKGTAKPTHYFAVLDEVFRLEHKNRSCPDKYKNAADLFEQFTHSLSYNYGRATKAIRVCPPARYADMACDRARQYLKWGEEVKPHDNLKDSMFYI